MVSIFSFLPTSTSTEVCRPHFQKISPLPLSKDRFFQDVFLLGDYDHVDINYGSQREHVTVEHRNKYPLGFIHGDLRSDRVLFSAI